MASFPWAKGPPKKILLATDLSCRCDRALDRAAQLARQWDSHLLAVHVLDPGEMILAESRVDDLVRWRPPQRVSMAKARIQRDLLQEMPHVQVRVEEGDPARVIGEVARAEKCDLIVTGIARDEVFGLHLLGATVERLVRRTPVPILVVKARTRPYREVVVATDFSDHSIHGLNAAAKYFPEASLTLFHAFELPFAGLLDKRGLGDPFGELEREACDKFLASSDLTEERRRSIKVVIKNGSPEATLRDYMLDGGVNLVALTTHGRSGIYDVLIGSVAKRILETAPGDVLLLRDPRTLSRG